MDVDDGLRRADEVHVEQREPLGVVVGVRCAACSKSSVSQKIDAVSASAIGSRRCNGVRSASVTLWNA